MHQHITGQRQQDRRDAGEQVHIEPVVGEHGGAFGHQAPGHHLQATQVTGIDGRRQGGKRHAVDVGQMLHVAQGQPMIHGHRGQRRHRQIARVDHQQRRLAWGADGQQGLAVAHHVLEQRRLGLDQVQGIAVIEEGAQLVDAGDQGNVVAMDQLALQVAVQRHAQQRQRDKRQQGEHQRQAQGQGVAEAGGGLQRRHHIHGCIQG
ncbi:hypothetical protein D3C86_1233790 [compost metagenome]